MLITHLQFFVQTAAIVRFDNCSWSINQLQLFVELLLCNNGRCSLQNSSCCVSCSVKPCSCSMEQRSLFVQSFDNLLDQTTGNCSIEQLQLFGATTAFVRCNYCRYWAKQLQTVVRQHNYSCTVNQLQLFNQPTAVLRSINCDYSLNCFYQNCSCSVKKQRLVSQLFNRTATVVRRKL